MSELLIETHGLSKEYRSRKHRPGILGLIRGLVKPEYVGHSGLLPVDLILEPGEILGVLGPNGAGKSTLIKLLTGIQAPTGGTLSVLGMRPSDRSRELLMQIGVVFGHKSSLWWDLPVRMSFDSIRRIYNLDEVSYRERLDRLVSALGLNQEILERPARVLSLGERVKCEVLGALLHEPKLLFLDEPTVGLDITSRTELRALLKKYALEQQIGIILTSHDVGDIETCCSRVLLINQGSVAFNGKIEALKASFSDMVRLKIAVNDRLFTDLDTAEIKSRLNLYLSSSEEIKVSHEVIEVTLLRKHSRRAISALADIEMNVSIELREPDLEEILLHHFKNFPKPVRT